MRAKTGISERRACGFGYRRIHALLRREGEHVNVKCVHHQVWSMDFVSDALEHGRRLKCLTIVDDCSKEAAAMEIYQNWNATPMSAPFMSMLCSASPD